jgi:hypothetical protein
MSESLPIDASLDKVKMSREPLDDCFNYVVTLLDEAIKDLPSFKESLVSDMGRITSVIALSVKAQVLLTAASPLFNGQWGYHLYNKDGTALFPAENQATILDKWTKAADACKIAVSEAEKNGFRLYRKDDFKESGTVSDTTKLKVVLRYRMTEPDDNPEVIWPHTNSLASGYQTSVMVQYFSKQDWLANGYYGVPLKISLMYHTKNGVPVEEDKEWNGVNLNEVTMPGADHFYLLKSGRNNVRRNLNREARFYSDLVFDGALVYGHRRTYSTDDQNNSALNGCYVNYWGGGWSIAGYAYKRCPFGYWPAKVMAMDTGHEENRVFTTNYAFPAMRLADLYLMYAEALLETNDLAQAKTYIDKIRERAGLKGVDEAWTSFSNNPQKPSTQRGLREIIHRERLIEMAFEGSRFWDLRRWLEAAGQCNAPVQSWNATGLANAAEYYQVQTVYYPNFTEKDYFFPIPEGQLINNPNLVQNFGW